MTDETVETPEVETPEVETPAPEQTVAEALQVEKKEDVVPLATFLDTKKEIKELKATIEKLQAQDKPKAEITADLKALADEHGVDAGFLDKLAKTIKAQTEADFDEKLRPLAEKEKADKIDKAFQDGFAKAMDAMPEFEGVVNPEVIKSLSLDPRNAQKTFRQLIEETYGNALSGKRTIETTTPRGGATPGVVDRERAKRDIAYFKEVMSDPDLKKQYNEGLAQEIVR